ncbi:hypothetical protein ACOMHN_018616 [Nucella lapillus]
MKSQFPFPRQPRQASWPLQFCARTWQLVFKSVVGSQKERRNLVVVVSKPFGFLIALNMKVLLCFALLMAVARKSYGQGEAPIQCQETEAAQRKSCFSDRQLTLAVMPKNLDQANHLYSKLESTLTMMDPTVHCSDPMKYSEAANCAINVSKACYDPDGTRNVVMNAADVIAGMKVLCDKRQEVDMECFKYFYVMVDECTKYHRARNAPSGSSDPRHSICAKDDIQYDCMEALMEPMCGENTTRVFLDQMNNYTITPACANGYEPSRERTRYFAALNEQKDPGGSASSPSPFPPLFLLLLLLVPLVSRAQWWYWV